MSEKLKSLQRDGFLILRNVFGPNELEKIKRFALDHDHDGSVENFRCLLSLEGSECLFKNENLRDIITEVLPQKPVYFGDSSLTVNKGESFIGEGSHEYHKDCADRSDFNAPDWTRPEPYSLIRMGIYLDDFSIKSGGIAFRKKSHKPERIRKRFERRPLIYILHFWDLLVGRAYYSAPKSGDLVMWYLNTDHAGNARFLKFSPKRAITKYINFFPSFLTSRPNKETRRVLFFVFGVRDKHLERYVEQNKTRDFMINSWMKSKYKRSHLEDEYFFDLIDVGEDLRQLDKQGRLPENRRGWVALPY